MDNHNILLEMFIYPLSFLFCLNFDLATGVVIFFNILKELVTPPSTVDIGFSIKPLYACLASSVIHPYTCTNEGNQQEGTKGSNKKK